MTAHRRVYTRVIVLLVVAALTIWFARGMNWRAAADAVRGADLRLLALALVANLASLTLKGIRWWVFLRRAGVRSLALVLRATYAGAALNNIVVAQGGDGARVLAVARGARIPAAHALAALAVERVFDGGCYLALLVGASWLMPLPPAVARWRPAAALLLLLLVAALGALALARPRDVASPTGGLFGFARRFATGATALASPASVGIAALLSVGAWVLQLCCYHLAARAAQLPVPPAASVAAMLAVGLGFLVRVTPGNVGVFQVLYALGMRSFGVAEGPAVGAAVLIQAIQVLPVLLLGLLSAPGLLSRDDMRR